MATQRLTPTEQINYHIECNNNFVLQGGAGSGKTETLKQVVQTIKKNSSSKKIACITHTNKAADEIADRVPGDYKVSTIHAFLSDLVRPFKANIKYVFPQLFTLPEFTPPEVDSYETEKVWKTARHKSFKTAHEKLTARRFTVLSEVTEKVTGKLEFDKHPDQYTSDLNNLISNINKEIVVKISKYDPSDIFYNESSAYNNFRGGYGHDGLIEIATKLFDNYPILGKILSDKFDCIFIDEFQDTNPDIIRILLDVSAKSNIVIGLFGDSEQAIYKEGIGDDVGQYISTGSIQLINKVDNYRCSPQVITVANRFRCDNLHQEIALKKLDNGDIETLESRQGSAKFYYAVAPVVQTNTGNAKNDKEIHKENCVKARDWLVTQISTKHNFKQLKLTNKAIAYDASFGTLWDAFSTRYSETRESMKKTLDQLQFGQVVELVDLFKNIPNDRRSYNRLISKLRNNGFTIRFVADKKTLNTQLEKISEGKLGAYETIEFALSKKFINQTDSHKAYIDRKNSFLSDATADPKLSEFENLFNRGNNTKIRMGKAVTNHSCSELTIKDIEEEFDEMKYKVRHKKLLHQLFSNQLKFSEIIAFYEYEEDDDNSEKNGNPAITMHKTKGTGIENVIVVLDEYAWNQEYDFLSCFSGRPPSSPKEALSRKLLYVACSRTKKNLVCVRLVADKAEAEKIAKFFPDSEEIQLPSI